MIDKVKEFIWENKEGMLIGGASGAIVFWLFNKLGIDLGIVFQTHSIIDSILPANPITLIWWKTLILFILIGVSVGVTVDQLLEENWLGAYF